MPTVFEVFALLERRLVGGRHRLTHQQNTGMYFFVYEPIHCIKTNSFVNINCACTGGTTRRICVCAHNVFVNGPVSLFTRFTETVVTLWSAKYLVLWPRYHKAPPKRRPFFKKEEDESHNKFDRIDQICQRGVPWHILNVGGEDLMVSIPSPKTVPAGLSNLPLHLLPVPDITQKLSNDADSCLAFRRCVERGRQRSGEAALPSLIC